MKRVEKQDEAAPGAVVQQTVTTKTVGPAMQPAFPQIPVSPGPSARGKEDVNEWFRKLSHAERCNEYNYYIYRLDRNVVITNQDTVGREPHKYLSKIKPEVLTILAQGSFMDELLEYVQEQFGGGKYSLKISSRKTGLMIHAKLFDIEGEPKLTPREGFAPGTAPAGALDGTNIGMLMRYIDERTKPGNTGQSNPAETASQIMHAVMEANNKALEFALARQPKASTPEESLANMLNIFKAFQSAQPAPAAPVALPAPKSFMEQMQEFNAMTDMLKKLKGETASEGPGLASQIVTALKDSGVVGGRARGTDFMPIVLKVGEMLAPAIVPIGVALAEKIRTGPTPGQAPARSIGPRIVPQPAAAAPTGGAMPSGGAMPGGGAAGGMASPGAAHGTPVAMPGQPGGPPPMAPQGEPPAPPAGEYTQADFDAFTQYTISTRLVDMLLHDRSGEDAAASIQDMFPEAAVRMRFATIPMLQAHIAENPILSQVKDDPRLPDFLQGFFDYFHPAPDAEEENDPHVN